MTEKTTDCFDEQENAENNKELYEHFHVSVDLGQIPIRIDKFLSIKLGKASRSRIQAAAGADRILVNGKSVKASYKIKPGDEISVVFDFPRRELELTPENIPLNIQYEDDQLMVVNKPAGMVVHPGHGNYTGTLANGLVYYLKALPMFSNSDDVRPGLVHRIDKNTSGLLVIAKTEEAKVNLSHQFFLKITNRKYIALVWGRFTEKEGTIDTNIGRSRKNRQIFTVYDDQELGKHAVTHYKVLEELGYVTLVECQLETGRTHQIRVHMKYIGHPIFNDEVYGGDKILWGTTFTKYRQFVKNCFKILPRQALHAKTLGFIHPVTGKEMLFDSELPTDMQEVIKKWRNYINNREIEL